MKKIYLAFLLQFFRSLSSRAYLSIDYGFVAILNDLAVSLLLPGWLWAFSSVFYSVELTVRIFNIKCYVHRETAIYSEKEKSKFQSTK